MLSRASWFVHDRISLDEEVVISVYGGYGNRGVISADDTMAVWPCFYTRDMANLRGYSYLIEFLLLF
jgi:hypothetical protein